MKRILIDLTDLEAWSGHHGGTQRVVYGIAKEFYDKKDDITDAEVVFMSFSNENEMFHESSFRTIINRVEQANTAAKTTGPAFVNSESRKIAIKRRIKRHIPEKVWQNPRLQRIARQSLSLAVRARRRARHRLNANVLIRNINARPFIEIQTGDTVLILGKPWDNPKLQRHLGRRKQQVEYRLAQVVYDLIICLNPHLHHPDLFTVYTQHMFEAISTSDVLLPISKSSAQDVRIFCKRLNISVPQMKVIRLGDTLDDLMPLNQSPDQRVQSNFVLCVGTVEIRKNHQMLYYAYRLAYERKIALPQLVIVGSRGWLTGDLQYLLENDPVIKAQIVILDNVDDSALAWLYQNCRYTIYPSMYEGWGLPVAESLARGKLCLASNSSSVPEIAGDLLDYISPYDPAQCVDLMQRYSNDKLLKVKETVIIERYKTTEWSETFDQVLKALS